MKKKLLLFTAAILAVAVGVVGMSAYEAHVINVTATIENALSVSPDDIMFGTVFPQEHLIKNIRVSLSQSFVDEERVDDIKYQIVQKLKPVPQGYDGPYEDLSDLDLTGVQLANPYYPSLCGYLSKHKDVSDPDSNQTENEVDAFHNVRTWTGEHVMYDGIATGYLSKADGDTEDIWAIDLATPCFEGMCAQDWETWVAGINDSVNAADYTLPADLEHAAFGCDLWIEVTGVSRSNKIGIYKEADDYPDGDPNNMLGDRIGTVTYEVSGGNLTGTVIIDTPEGQAWIDSGHSFTMVLNGPRTGATTADSTNGRLAQAACNTVNAWDGGWWSSRTTDNTGMTDGNCDGFDDSDGVTPLDWMEGYYNFEGGISGSTLKGAGYAFSISLPSGSYNEVQFLLKDEDGGWASVGEYPGAGEVDGLTSWFDFTILP